MRTTTRLFAALALAGGLGLAVGTSAVAGAESASKGADKQAAKAPATTTADPANVVKYRHNQMEALGKHMKLLYMIVGGEVPYTGQAAAHADAMHTLVATIPELFPAGTGPDKVKTDSLPAVWSQWDKFLQSATEAEQATAKLAEVAKGGDMAKLKAQFDVTRKACGSCHELFKEDDEH